MIIIKKKKNYILFQFLCFFQMTLQTSLICFLLIHLLSLQMPTHTHKINPIPTLILEILLIYHFEVLCASSTMSDHTHLIFMNQFVASTDDLVNSLIPLFMGVVHLIPGSMPLRRVKLLSPNVFRRSQYSYYQPWQYKKRKLRTKINFLKKFRSASLQM